MANLCTRNPAADMRPNSKGSNSNLPPFVHLLFYKQLPVQRQKARFHTPQHGPEECYDRELIPHIFITLREMNS